MPFTRLSSEVEVITVAPGASVFDASRVFAERHVGAVIVVDHGKPVGILTDRDVVVRVIAAGLDPSATTVGSVMSRDLVVAREGSAPADLALVMAERGVRRVPLVDAGGRLAGLISLDDLIRLYGHGLGCLARAVVREQASEAAASARD